MAQWNSHNFNKFGFRDAYVLSLFDFHPKRDVRLTLYVDKMMPVSTSKQPDDPDCAPPQRNAPPADTQIGDKGQFRVFGFSDAIPFRKA